MTNRVPVEYRDELITTNDGRILEIASLGNPDGPTIVFHHGTPGSAPLVKSFAAAAAEHGYFFVTTSRPGYGRSTRHEGRSVADVVSDVNLALDHLGRDRYIAVGWSGGGPHALACGALGAPRCVAAFSIAGVAPFDADFDWTEGMGPENIEEIALAKSGGPEYEAHMKATSDSMSTANEANVIELFGGLLSDVDKDALADDDARGLLAEALRHGLGNGHHGFIDDDQVFLKDWGFNLADVIVPVEIWYGDEDLMVPPTHARYLLTQLPGSSAFHRPSEGHVSIVNNFHTELFEHLNSYRSS